LRDAIKYLEQVSIVGEVNSENASKFLGLAPERQIKSFLETVETNDIKSIFQKIEDLQNQ
jgi:DNA polymerase III gamma/tau subunit